MNVPVPEEIERMGMGCSMVSVLSVVFILLVKVEGVDTILATVLLLSPTDLAVVCTLVSIEVTTAAEPDGST